MTEKLYNNCLIEGSFNPPHKGHINMIGYALSLAENVYVHVGMSSLVDILSYDEKVALIYMNVLRTFDSYAANRITFVYNQDEDYPVLNTDPHGTVLSEEYWTQYLNKIHEKMQLGEIGLLDCIVSSDKYGARIADELNIDWVMYDPDRRFTPTSSTQIRKGYDRFPGGAVPSNVWNHSLPELTFKFSRMFVVNGTEGSGKSTQIDYARQSYLTSKTVDEYGRTYTVKKLNHDPEYQLTLQDFKNIVLGHHFQIERAKTSTTSGLVFVDTDALTTFIYAKYYLSNDDRLAFEGWCLPFVETQLGMADMYFLTSPDVYNDNDGTRTLTEEQRKDFYARLTGVLNEYKIPFIPLPNSTTMDVYNTMMQAVKNELKTNRLMDKKNNV